MLYNLTIFNSVRMIKKVPEPIKRANKQTATITTISTITITTNETNQSTGAKEILLFRGESHRNDSGENKL